MMLITGRMGIPTTTRSVTTEWECLSLRHCAELHRSHSHTHSQPPACHYLKTGRLPHTLLSLELGTHPVQEPVKPALLWVA